MCLSCQSRASSLRQWLPRLFSSSRKDTKLDALGKGQKREGRLHKDMDGQGQFGGATDDAQTAPKTSKRFAAGLADALTESTDDNSRIVAEWQKEFPGWMGTYITYIHGLMDTCSDVTVQCNADRAASCDSCIHHPPSQCSPKIGGCWRGARTAASRIDLELLA